MAWSDAPYRDVPQCGMCGGYDKAFPSTGVGLGGPSPGIFFINITSEKDILGAIMKTREKRLKKFFHRNWEKKFFCLKKG